MDGTEYFHGPEYVYTGSESRPIIKQNDSFFGALVKYSTEYEQSAAVTRVHKCYSENIDDVMEEIWQHARSKGDLTNL